MSKFVSVIAVSILLFAACKKDDAQVESIDDKYYEAPLQKVLFIEDLCSADDPVGCSDAWGAWFMLPEIINFNKDSVKVFLSQDSSAWREVGRVVDGIPTSSTVFHVADSGLISITAWDSSWYDFNREVDVRVLYKKM